MIEVDEARLYGTDLQYRYGYLADFIGISDTDIQLVHGLLFSSCLIIFASSSHLAYYVL